MTDTEFMPITEVEVEMTVGELRAILAADTINRQSAEIERLGRDKYDLTIELEAAKEIIRRLEARWQVAQADYRAVMQAIRCESISEVPDKLRAAERERDEARGEIERLMKERDEAYRKGQEDMRGRAAKVCFQTRGSTIAGTRIRALKIKDTPDAE